MSHLSELFDDLDQDLLQQAAEEEAAEEEARRALLSSVESHPSKKLKPSNSALMFKPSTVSKQETTKKASVVVVASSAAPTLNREYFEDRLGVSNAQTKARIPPSIPLPPPPIVSKLPETAISSSNSETGHGSNFRLFVGNLASEARKESLMKVFKEYPSVIHVEAVLDKAKEKCLGYGFVTFKDPFEMLKALREKNGKLCFNRPMQISKAKPDSDPSKKFKSGARKVQQ